ncbi:MAG: hypothetical protein LBF74_11640, partial [Treponema sp.]|nr:hypothetical protein [Treponema sp.]
MSRHGKGPRSEEGIPAEFKALPGETDSPQGVVQGQDFGSRLNGLFRDSLYTRDIACSRRPVPGRGWLSRDDARRRRYNRNARRTGNRDLPWRCGLAGNGNPHRTGNGDLPWRYGLAGNGNSYRTGNRDLPRHCGLAGNGNPQRTGNGTGRGNLSEALRTREQEKNRQQPERGRRKKPPAFTVCKR